MTYDPESLAHIPEEILQKDYGCGDPDRYLEPGDTVLDLGSGAGKICYIAWKGKQGPCLERNQAVIYRGPWRTVTDGDGLYMECGDSSRSCPPNHEFFRTCPPVSCVGVLTVRTPTHETGQ